MRATSLSLWLFCITVTSSWSQSDSLNSVSVVLQDVNARQTHISRIGMSSLTGWSAGNMIVGGIFMGQSTGQVKYFNEMNLIWNVVNLGIGIPGLLGTYKERPGDFESTYKYQKRLENIYLLNAGLDASYVACGWALNNLGKTKDGLLGERLKGYGNSIVLQGGYLFLHDCIMYLLYKSNNKRLDMVWKHVTIQPTGFGAVINFR